jgi:hypothetical protein
MKTKYFLFVILFLITILNNYAQVNYSEPKEVAKGFLDLCLTGQRFEACKLYGTAGSEVQVSALIKMLVENDMPLINETCKYIVDSCKTDLPNNSAKCFYRKLCSDTKTNKKGYLTMKMLGNRWLVDYTWVKNRYL